MNIALWAAFVTSLLLISHTDGKGGRGGRGGHGSTGIIHLSSPRIPSYRSPPAPRPVVYAPSGGSSFKNSFVNGLGQGAGAAVGSQLVNRAIGGGGSSNTVHHVYSNQAAPAVWVPSSGPSVTVVQGEKKGFPVIYIVMIVIGCVVASIVLFLLIKLLVY